MNEIQKLFKTRAAGENAAAAAGGKAAERARAAEPATGFLWQIFKQFQEYVCVYSDFQTSVSCSYFVLIPLSLVFWKRWPQHGAQMDTKSIRKLIKF